MLVSRKNLAFIHLVPSEAAAGVDMAKPLHEGVHFLRVPGLGGELPQPLTESSIQRFALCPRT